MSSDRISAYMVAYEREELQFPVYLLAVIAFGLVAGGPYNKLPLFTALFFAPLTGVY